VNELAKTKSINLNDLTKLATWLDGYSVMSPVDPLRLRKITSRYPDDQDIGTAWKEIESDVWDIARIPSTSPEITRLSKILGVLKQVLMFVGLIVFTIYIIGSGLGTLNFLGRYGALVFAIIFILAYLLGFGSYFYLDRKLTRLVTNCYKKHANEISKQRKHVKQVNQRLIDKIAAEIRARRRDPQKYRFSLMQKDYSNIVVQKEQGDSIFVVSIKGSKKTD
jgi:ABC-type multidrug transport system fused ATPase/permease subunit